MSIKRSAMVLLAVGQVFLAGCNDDTPKEEPEEGGTDTGCVPEGTDGGTPIELESCSTLEGHVTGGYICGPCEDACQIMYWCYYGDGTQPEGGCPICADSEVGASNICQSEDFLDDTAAYAQEAPCYASASCAGWDPSTEISVNPVTGALEISQTFIDSVIADPNRLVGCDSTRFEALVTGSGFEVTGATSGDLLYEIGLRNSDIPLEINGYALEDFVDVAAAVVALSYSDPSTYSIKIDRGGTVTWINVNAV